jgi:hypothetical protein
MMDENRLRITVKRYIREKHGVELRSNEFASSVFMDARGKELYNHYYPIMYQYLLLELEEYDIIEFEKFERYVITYERKQKLDKIIKNIPR